MKLILIPRQSDNQITRPLKMGNIEYNVIVSRRRSISIIISPEKGVIVRAPRSYSLKAVEKFVEAKSGWIKKHVNNFSGITRINQDKKFIDGQILYFMGREYNLKTSLSAKTFVRLYDNVIEAGIPVPGDSAKVKALIDKWYNKNAKEAFAAELEKIIIKFSDYRFTPSAISVRSLKSRWGSCSSKGKITINTELIKLDERFQEYVIIHELCHLRHHNHGREYYELLEKLVPDYKEIRKELRRFSTR